MNPYAEERPVAELFGDLARETGTLVRQEMKLATTEMAEKAEAAARKAALVAVGGVLAMVALLTLVAALVLGIGEFIPLWGSALIVGLFLAGVAATFALVGVAALKHFDPKPRQTLYSLQETKSWAKSQAHAR